MNPRRHHSLFRHARPQRGVALIVILMFLLAITGIAVFSARNATVSEGVARNQLDYEVARQAAESALRDAERDLLLPDNLPRPGSLCTRTAPRPLFDQSADFEQPNCPQGQCVASKDANWETKLNAEVWWPESRNGLWNNDFSSKPSRGAAAGTNCNFNGGVPLGTYTGTPPINGVVRQPEYLMEYFQMGPKTYFRITARGFGYTEATQVVLQSYFVPRTLASN